MSQPADVLRHALSTSGIRAGDEVIVPSYGTVEAAEAVLGAGAVPVFADIDPDTYCLDPAAVADAVNPRTVAVVAVPQFGYRPDTSLLAELARAKGLLLLQQPIPPSSEADVALRRANASFLDKHLRGVTTPRVAPGAVHGYEQYVVRVPGNGRPDRDAFAQMLRGRGVRCRVPVATPVHRIPMFRTDVWLPETERAVGDCLALPVEPELTRRERQRIAAGCNALGGLMQPAL